MSSRRSRSGRHLDVHDLQPVEQVLAKALIRDPGDQVPMGRRDHAHVERRQRTIGSHTLNLAGLQESQQHRLHAQAHLADFIHEDRPVVGRLEPAALVAIGAGETAAHVAEELGLEKRVRETRTVDRDERRARIAALLVNEPRHELLADTALTRDQHLRSAPGGH